MLHTFAGLLVGAALASAVPSEGAEDWQAHFGGLSGLDANVFALAVHDDGSGQALYVGGMFASAGGVSAAAIARWDGSEWSDLAGGFAGGPGPTVRALETYDDGRGPALYAGGTFSQAGGVPAANIARWDGQGWEPLGLGVTGRVNALAVIGEPGGPVLYAGGAFSHAGNKVAPRIARWDGQEWSSPGGGLSGGNDPEVHALAVFDDGGGRALYAGGNFTFGSGQAVDRIARWDGTSWHPLGSGLSGSIFPTVRALAVHDDGHGEALYAGGAFTLASGQPVQNVARWDGRIWSGVGGGIGSAGRALVNFDEGEGPRVFVGGEFHTAGGKVARRLARWDGQEWSRVSGGGLNGQVLALELHDEGAGPVLHAGGAFESAGDQSLGRVARWTGSDWQALGAGVNGAVFALLSRQQGGSEPVLFAGGNFTSAGGLPAERVARWDGQGWSALGGGMNLAVSALADFDSGSGIELYAGGDFTTAGGVPASHIARWDGSAWHPLAEGVGGGSTPTVNALQVFDDGSGAALYVGGRFLTAGNLAASRVARWDGATWSPVGVGIGGQPFDTVYTFAVHYEGAGARLFAGGSFAGAPDGTFLGNIARWDGAAWTGLEMGMVSHSIFALRSIDTGSGPMLYAGGTFVFAGLQQANRIARWDGADWQALGVGLADSVHAIAGFDDDSGPAVAIGGIFTHSPAGDSHLARWSQSVGDGFTVLPGCLGNTLTLSATGPGLVLGRTTTFQTNSALGDGFALLYAGFDGTGGGGCGLLLPGIGELLLALVPQPLLLGSQPSPAGAAQFTLPIPNEPQFAGVTLAFQALHLALALPGTPFEASNALVAAITP